MKNILVISIIYSEYDIITKHVDFLIKGNDNYDIILLENKSASTPKIRDYCFTLLKNKDIMNYYLFEDNIGMNVFETIFFNKDINLDDYEYILMTDGDLTVENPNWFQEEMNILNNHPDSLCCGVTLDMSNLPIKVFPEAKSWYPKCKKFHEDCEEQITGLNLLLWRVSDFKLFLNYMKVNKMIYMDTTMHRYHLTTNKKWLRTKIARAYHHTWDLYANQNHPYCKMKNKGYKYVWLHGKFCNYSIYSLNENNVIGSVKRLKWDKDKEAIEKNMISKLHIGDSDIIFKDWMNININNPIQHKHWILAKRIPYNTNETKYIYSDYFIETLTKDEFNIFFKECYRILKLDSIMRVVFKNNFNNPDKYTVGEMKKIWGEIGFNDVKLYTRNESSCSELRAREHREDADNIFELIKL